ncbi:MAG: hypothetical protein ABL877_05830 [Thiobacillus sp.]
MTDHYVAERLTESYKSLVTLSVEAFRYLALINGGAIVALLAYLGNTKDGEAPELGVPLLWFIVGLVACGFAMAYAYLTQLRLFNDLLLAGKFSTAHKLTLWAAMLCYVISLSSFSYGAWLAIRASQ